MAVQELYGRKYRKLSRAVISIFTQVKDQFI